tara:strand:+ start:22305 stop:22676 length:372 start_codon:yes stop_codon:yes gene_type:complete
MSELFTNGTYVMYEGTKCPSCQSNDISVRFGSEKTCNSCQSEWMDIIDNSGSLVGFIDLVTTPRGIGIKKALVAVGEVFDGLALSEDEEYSYGLKGDELKLFHDLVTKCRDVGGDYRGFGEHE